MTVQAYPKAKSFSADFCLSRHTKADAPPCSFLRQSPQQTSPACLHQSTGKALRMEATPPCPHRGWKSKRGSAGGGAQEERRAKAEGCLTPRGSQGPDLHLLTEQLSRKSLNVPHEELGHDGHLGTISSRSGRDASTTANALPSSRG